MKHLARMFKLTLVLSSIALASGCLVSSPYHGQKLKSRTDSVPFQVWTIDKTKKVHIECAKPYAHGTLHHNYQLVKKVKPSSHKHFDSFGNIMYSASTKVVIPDACWQVFNFAGGIQKDFAWVRARQPGTEYVEFFTFDKNGLGCVGEFNGKAASWVGWIGHNCPKTFASGTPWYDLRIEAEP